MIEMAVIEQRFGGDTSNIETGSTQCRVLLYAGRLHTQLCRFDGCNVATGPGPNHHLNKRSFLTSLSLVKLHFVFTNKAGYTATSCGRVGRGGNARFYTFRLDHYGPTDGRTKPLIELSVRN